MAKRGGSCLKIIGCVGDPEENADVEAVEGRTFISKRKWSFRKRSASRRVLSNSVIKEPTSVTENGKESSETSSSYCCPIVDVPVSDKILKVKFVEEASPISMAKLKPEVTDPLPVTKGIGDSDSVKDTDNSDSVVKESVAIEIQTAIRLYLAHKEMAKIKSVVKLQAAVRGHLVRRQAIGTLRCVQAIVKMQALVRARHMKRNKEMLAEKTQVKENSNIKQNKVNSRTDKLLTNGFARQLLESASSRRTKTIHINCDPSKSDSAWKWLERWMTVTASVVSPQQELYLSACTQEQGEAVGTDAAEVLTEVKVASVPPLKKPGDGIKFDTCNDLAGAEVGGASIPAYSNPNLRETEIPATDFSSNEPDLSEFHDPGCSLKKGFSSQMKDHQQEFTTVGITEERGASDSSEISKESDSNIRRDSLSENRVVDMEKSRRTTKRMGEAREVENKTHGFGYKKSRNPAFAAVQSKFEELSATSNSNKLVGFCQEIAADKKPDTPPQGCPSKRSEVLFTENSSFPATRHQTAISECGTEISISSTLDSPDRSESEAGEIVLEIERRDCIANMNVHDACNSEKTDYEPKNLSTTCDILQEPGLIETGQDSGKYISSDVNSMNVDQQLLEPATADMPLQEPASSDMPIHEPAAPDMPIHEPAAPDMPIEEPAAPDMPIEEPAAPDMSLQDPAAPDMPIQEPSTPDMLIQESAASDMPPQDPAASDMLFQQPDASDMLSLKSAQLEEATEQQTCRSSPEGSPRSHLTASETQGTPSSEISSNIKKSKINNSHSRKQRFQLSGKNPSKTQAESDARTTADNLQNFKSDKRRKSLGMAKSDHSDHEPRVNSSKSIPNYMLATESAKAKGHASKSPKASPNVHEKDSNMIKRHSLPLADGKQVSLADGKQVSSPSMQRSTSQAQQTSKANGMQSPHTSAERKWQR